MTTRQLLILVAAVTLLSAGLAWWLQRYELSGLHSEIKGYLAKHDAFRAWEDAQP